MRVHANHARVSRNEKVSRHLIECSVKLKELLNQIQHTPKPTTGRPRRRSCAMTDSMLLPRVGGAKSVNISFRA